MLKHYLKQISLLLRRWNAFFRDFHVLFTIQWNWRLYFFVYKLIEINYKHKIKHLTSIDIHSNDVFLVIFDSPVIGDDSGDNMSNVIHCYKRVGERCKSLQQLFVEISVIFLPRRSDTLNRRKYFPKLWKRCSLRYATPVAFFSFSFFLFSSLVFNSILAMNKMADVWKRRDVLLNRRGIFHWIGVQQNGKRRPEIKEIRHRILVSNCTRQEPGSYL